MIHSPDISRNADVFDGTDADAFAFFLQAPLY
jgi:hypothetical protein